MARPLIAGALALALGCSRPPPPDDPGLALYHQAVVRFAALVDETKDLTYRDPRFDEVLRSCDDVPPISEVRAKAVELADRIRAARALANIADGERSTLEVQAQRAPQFVPEGVQLPTGPPSNLSRAEDNVPRSNQPLGAALGLPTNALPSGKVVPYDPSRPRALPDWYRQKGYFGLKPDAPDSAPAPAPASVDVPSPAAPPSMPGARKGKSTPPPPPPEPQGPPPVFGLPGPAGHALAPPTP